MKDQNIAVIKDHPTNVQAKIGILLKSFSKHKYFDWISILLSIVMNSLYWIELVVVHLNRYKYLYYRITLVSIDKAIKFPCCLYWNRVQQHILKECLRNRAAIFFLWVDNKRRSIKKLKIKWVKIFWQMSI